jgi:lysophospholipase L1-like esterase
MNRRNSIRKSWNLFSGMIRYLFGDPNAWESSILQFEKEERISPSITNGILFIGSSTFTLWKTLEKDMTPLKVLNRGFGGSRIADMSKYYNRLVLPYNPKAIVLFAGTNDISGRKPATAQEIFQGYLSFIQHVRETLPKTQIYYVAITPTPSRWKYWEIAREVNKLIREHTEENVNLHFIDPTTKFLGSDGKPIRTLFRIDKLHPNEKGYRVLTDTIKPILKADLGE